MNELGGTNSPRADTHFRVASNTKTMTAAVIVLLVGRKIVIRRTGPEIC
jgi:CubicO group peptidase (beta-lactamase class C family)